MSIEIKNQVVRNPEGKVKVWTPSPSGRDHYHIGVWVEAPDPELDRIDHVTYLLHETFAKPERRSANRINKFGITFWTWGMFTIRVTIHYKDGHTRSLNYDLSYRLPESLSEYTRVE